MSRSSAAVRERQLEAVALGPGPAGLRVGDRAVRRGVDVGPAGEQQAVDAVEQLVRVFGNAIVGRQQQRVGTGALDHGRVRPRHQVHRLLPHSPAHALERGADTDGRGCHQSLSKPLYFSQSVTAPSNASSSTWARFT